MFHYADSVTEQLGNILGLRAYQKCTYLSPKSFSFFKNRFNRRKNMQKGGAHKIAKVSQFTKTCKVTSFFSFVIAVHVKPYVFSGKWAKLEGDLVTGFVVGNWIVMGYTTLLYNYSLFWITEFTLIDSGTCVIHFHCPHWSSMFLKINQVS